MSFQKEINIFVFVALTMGNDEQYEHSDQKLLLK